VTFDAELANKTRHREGKISKGELSLLVLHEDPVKSPVVGDMRSSECPSDLLFTDCTQTCYVDSAVCSGVTGR